MMNLLLHYTFLFLQFFLGYIFHPCNLLFWFRNNLFLFSKDHLDVIGGAHERVNLILNSVKYHGSSWVICSPGYAQRPENLHINSRVQHYSLLFKACSSKIQHSFWDTDPMCSSCLIWANLLTPHCNDRTVCTAFTK